MSVRERRREKGWSQEQLAQMTGLSVRTIQRFEQGQKAGLESLKCLAAVFETNVSELMKENDDMIETTGHDVKRSENSIESYMEAEAIEYVKNLKGFHLNWMMYLIVIPSLGALNYYVTPGYWWVIWPAAGWALGILIQAIVVFGLFGVFGADWEQKQFKKRMQHKHRF